MNFNYEENEHEAIIQLRNIHKSFLLGESAVTALRGINLDVYRNEILGIYGESGSGKSTLLNIIGLIDPQR